MGWRLLTFGRLALLLPDGTDESSLTTRRRKLALLAYLALQKRPTPRSVLLDVFWGERDEDRARNSLSDALSHLRRVLGEDVIITHGADVAIAPHALTAIDAIELDHAARQGNHSRGLELYTGAFLEGVFVEGSSDFEDWSARERQRFSDMVATSCAARCLTLSRGRQWTECAATAERWLDLRPASSDAALYLMNALKAPGTREAMRRALDAYEQVVRRLARELEIQPESEVRHLAAEISKQLQASPTPQQSPAPVALHRETPMRLAEKASGGAKTRRFSRRQLIIGAGLAVTVTLGLAAVWKALPRSLATGGDVRRLSALSEAAATARPVIAIAHIDIGARDSSVAWLAEGLPALIAAKLGHVSEVEVLAPEQTLLRAGEPPSAAVVRFNAAALATGVVSRSAGQLRLSLAVHGHDGRLLAHRDLAGVDAVHIADAAAVMLLNSVDMVVDGPSLGELETSNVAAYQLYAEAQRSLGAGDMAAGTRALDAAIADDSDFVSALFTRYHLAAVALDLRTVHQLASRIALNHPRASEYDRLQVDINDAFMSGDRDRTEFLAATLIARYPHSLRAYAAAEEVYQFHGRDREASDVLARWIALAEKLAPSGSGSDPLRCPPYLLRTEMRRAAGDFDGAVADARILTELCPFSVSSWGTLAWALISSNRFDEASGAIQRMAPLSGDEPRWTIGRLLLRQRRWGSVDSAVAVWQHGGARARQDAMELAWTVARERGQFARSTRIQESVRDYGGDWVPQEYLDNLARSGRVGELRRFAAAELLRGGTAVTLSGDTLFLQGAPLRAWVWHRALFADAIARSGDTLTVRALADSLSVIGPRSFYYRDWRVHHHLRGLLLARAGHYPEALREFQAALCSLSGWTRTNLELANSFRALHRPAEAIAILRGAYAANVEAMGRYVPQSELDYHMALAFRDAGRADSAAVYGRYVRAAWAEADASVRALLDSLPAARPTR